MNLSAARKQIKPTTNTVMIRHDNAGVPEILDLIFVASKYGPSFTAKFAPALRGQTVTDTLENVWRFVRQNVKYKRDAAGKEKVKSPGKLIYDGVGDCKSFSVIIASILTNLGIKWKYRVAFYDPKQPNAGHIYPVAIVGGNEIIVDAVHDTFDEEVEYWRAYDYAPNGEQIKKHTGTAGGYLSGPPANLQNIFLAGLLLFAAVKINPQQ